MSLGFIDFPDFNPAAKKAQSAASQAKELTAKAQVLAETHKIEKRHWDKLDNAERKFNKALNTLDLIYPENKRGLADSLGKQMGAIALLASLALIGSTAFLYVWVNRKED